jgi:uncharacterized repeat protein (TIGR01451 family)
MQQTQTRRRIILVVAVALAGVLLAGVIAAAQTVPPSFLSSTKTGPRFAEQGDVITYTIEVTNTGGLAEGVVLQDPLPDFTTLESCTYEYVGSEFNCAGPPGPLWTLNFATGQGARTTLAVRVNAGTLSFPVVNEATVGWEDWEWQLGPVTTVVNPYRIYLPLVAKAFGS